MSLEDVKKISLAEWVADDSVLLLWVTDPLPEKAFAVIRGWGFTCKTVGFYWVKQNPGGSGFFAGLGFRTRANPERCLLATRPSPGRKSADVPKLVVSPRREHSREPGEMYGLNERLADGPLSRNVRPDPSARVGCQGRGGWSVRSGQGPGPTLALQPLSEGRRTEVPPELLDARRRGRPPKCRPVLRPPRSLGSREMVPDLDRPRSASHASEPRWPVADGAPSLLFVKEH